MFHRHVVFPPSPFFLLLLLLPLSPSRHPSIVESRSVPRHDSKDRDGQSSPVSRISRSSNSPTTMLSGGGERRQDKHSRGIELIMPAQ